MRACVHVCVCVHVHVCVRVCVLHEVYVVATIIHVVPFRVHTIVVKDSALWLVDSLAPQRGLGLLGLLGILLIGTHQQQQKRNCKKPNIGLVEIIQCIHTTYVRKQKANIRLICTNKFSCVYTQQQNVGIPIK